MRPLYGGNVLRLFSLIVYDLCIYVHTYICVQISNVFVSELTAIVVVMHWRIESTKNEFPDSQTHTDGKEIGLPFSGHKTRRIPKYKSSQPTSNHTPAETLQKLAAFAVFLQESEMVVGSSFSSLRTINEWCTMDLPQCSALRYDFVNISARRQKADNIITIRAPMKAPRVLGAHRSKRTGSPLYEVVNTICIPPTLPSVILLLIHIMQRVPHTRHRLEGQYLQPLDNSCVD